jgi:uncharacterized damage-inducible protein DinB
LSAMPTTAVQPSLSPARHGSIQGCLDACQQSRDLVDVLLPGQYGLSLNGQSSIGAHMRHSLDHFLTFFGGLAEGEIDYDARERDPRIEHDPVVFREVLDQVCASLRKLDESDVSRRLVLHQLPAPGREPIRVATTVDRELLFLMSHCIHHLAIVMMLVKQLGLSAPANIGVAYSTAAYRQSLASGQESH